MIHSIRFPRFSQKTTVNQCPYCKFESSFSESSICLSMGNVFSRAISSLLGNYVRFSKVIMTASCVINLKSNTLSGGTWLDTH